MSYAEYRAKAAGSTSLMEREISAAVKRRGSSAIADLVGPGAPGSMFNESYGQSSRAKEAYAQITNWVWSCIHVVAKRCMGQPWMAGHFEKPADGTRRAGPLTAKGYQRSRIPKLRKAMAWSEQDIEQDPDHPVLWTLDKPNHVQGKAEMIYMMVANILATGEWYWIGGVVGQNSKKKIELWAVPSSWIVPDHRAGPFRGYILQTGYGTGIPLPPENVARAYFPDPSDPKACMSPLHACMRSARIDNYILRSQEQSFERGINPNLLVTVGKFIGPDGKVQMSPPRLTGAQRRQIIRAVRHIWSQTVAAGDPAILDGLIEDVKKLQLTPQEMDWQNSGMTIKARIMQAFGVNPIILGEVTPANKAQAVVAESNFCRNVVNPLLSGISTAASAFFTPFYEDGDALAVWLEQAEAHDDEMEFRRMSEARKNGDVTQDQYLAYMGLPPVDPKDKKPEKSPLFNNPQTLAQVAALAAQVSAGAMSHDNAVQTLMVMLQISEDDADAMMPDDPPEPPPMPAVPPGGAPGPAGAVPAKPPAKPKPPVPAAAEEPEKGYDPSQPRDESGRWSSGGGPAPNGDEWKASMTDGQTAAVDKWVTGGRGIEEIREHERGERTSQTGKDWEQALDNAPLADGIVHRGIGGLLDEDLDEMAEGAEFELEHSVSFSGKQDVAEKFAEKKTYDDEQFVVMTMKVGGSNQARDITAGNRYGEKEVILRKGARIRVDNSESIEINGKYGRRLEVSLVD